MRFIVANISFMKRTKNAALKFRTALELET